MVNQTLYGLFLLCLSMHCFVACLASETSNHQLANQTFRSKETPKLKKMITSRLQQINKPAVKTIQSPDGDIIDCILSHNQPAFDHPLLKGQKPLDPEERPRGHNQTDILSDNIQLWSLSGESCPEGTIPIRRTKKEDILRASSINTFGRKLNQVGVDTTKYKHVYSYGSVTGDRYYGAKATINLWSPHVEGEKEFSLSQIWLVTGRNSNTIEAGWQVSHQNYGDYRPRLFVYWTADAYKQTGCYNLRCPGFVQTSKTFAFESALSPVSTYNGRQIAITLLIYKDKKNGNWWLSSGSGNIIGYWPSSLFTSLKDSATKVEFGGEVYIKSTGTHSSTQMGSGHFADEGFSKASLFRDMQVVNSDNQLIPLSNLNVYATEPNCYNVVKGINNEGVYFYYGGPGRNKKCP